MFVNNFNIESDVT